MAKSQNKTVANKSDVVGFIDSIEDPIRKTDSIKLKKIMEDITGEKAIMWGNSIIGFGEYHYVYASGREGDYMKVGFSPRKQSMTLYIMPGFKNYDDLLKKLGKHKSGKSCLYIKSLEDIDIKILKSLIQNSYECMHENYE